MRTIKNSINLKLTIILVMFYHSMNGQFIFSMIDCGGQNSLINPTTPNIHQFNAIGSQNDEDNISTNCAGAFFSKKTDGGSGPIKLVRTSNLDAFTGVTKTSFIMYPNIMLYGSTGLYFGNDFTDDYLAPTTSNTGLRFSVNGTGFLNGFAERLIINGYSNKDLRLYFPDMGSQDLQLHVTIIANHTNQDAEFDDLQGHLGIVGSKKYMIYVKWNDVEYFIMEENLGTAPITDIKFLSHGISGRGRIRALNNLIIENLSYTNPNYAISTASGNWHSSSTWQNGTIPTSDHSVKINPWHTVSINSNDAECKNLFISSTSSLNITAKELTVGLLSGDNKLVSVGDALNLTSGAKLNLNGRLVSSTNYSKVNLSADSEIKINWRGKLISSEYLVDFLLSNYEFENGTIYFKKTAEVKRLIQSSRYLGRRSTIIIGDSTEIHYTGNIKREVNVPAIGNLIINQTTNLGDSELNIKGIPNNYSFVYNVENRAPNNLISAIDLCVMGDFDNEGTVKVTNRFGFGIPNVSLNPERGPAKANWIQNIRGSGLLETNTIVVANTSMGGILLHNDFAPKRINSAHSSTLSINEGKIFLGNNTMSVYEVLGNSSNYVVINGAGELEMYHDFINFNRTFHIGDATSYTPITIAGTGAGGGARATFRVGMSTGNLFPLSSPATGRINREFVISKLNGNLSNPTLKVQWNLSDEIGYIDRDKFIMANHAGTSWTVISSPSSPSGSNPYSLTANSITQWGRFSILSNGVKPPCPDFLQPNELEPEYYEGTSNVSAKKGITSISKIFGSAKVSYSAESIILSPGFSAAPGTVFLAKTGGCL